MSVQKPAGFTNSSGNRVIGKTILPSVAGLPRFVKTSYSLFEWKSPVQFKAFAHQADPLTHGVVSFAEHADGCQIHQLHSGWRSSENWLAAYQWQENAWQMGLGNLLKLIEESQ